MKFSKRMLSASLFMLAGVFLFSSCSMKEKDRSAPNIVLIYLDDMGYGDLTITGANDYSTPNLDKIANHGMFFSHYYSPQAVCSASRVGLLTGCYPNRVGISGALSHRSKTGISDDEETIAQVLKKKGYATAIFGKWHLGYQKQFLPTNHGFDEFYGIPYSHDMWPLHPTGTYPELPLYENETIVNSNLQPEDVAHFTADFVDKTIDFMKRNQDKPFFVYWPNPLPHVPLYASEKFKGKSKQGIYGDVMMEIDWGVGEIMKALEETGLDENTLVIFTSDNGPWLNYGDHAGSTGGLREGKGTSYEGGQRVPCLMMWKGVIQEGVVCNNLVSGIDILPTLAAITEAPLPKNKIDGVNILPLLKGDFAANPRKDFYYYYRRNNLEAVRNESWKLVFPHPGRTYEGFQPGKDGMPGALNENFSHEGGLYDLRRDPGERYDVSESNPEIVKMLEKIAEEARIDLGDDLTDSPGKNRRNPGRVTD
ncbi:sulfatase family protein [Sunxiuqinia sp. A32]|uniref:sulfatase family protein n=1 Tax=Sunxiuqinia sp. A32 TaxID=3461496 RepID=UPI004045BA1C